MKSLIEKYKKATPQEVIQEIAKVTISRDLTKEELEKAYSIVELKAAPGKSNDTSLLSKTEKNSDGNATSLQNAEVSEEDIKVAIAEVTKVAEPVKVVIPVEVAELQKKLDEANATLAVAVAKIAEFTKAQEDAKVAEAAKAKVDLLKARRDELAEVAKDMSDEDILDEVKFTIAKKDKEIALLKAGTKTVVDLSKGSKDKKEVTPEQASRDKIAGMAFDKRYRKENAAADDSSEAK